MSYSLNRFLKPLNESDKTIKIYDDRNYPVYTINPFSVLQIYVSNNNLIVSLTGTKIIILDFLSNEEAKVCLIKLQSYVDQLIQSATLVDNNSIDQAILSSAGDGVLAFNGSTASIQDITTTNDDNIEIDLLLSDTSIVGTNSVTSAVHNLSVKWTGILSMERGGLNNTLFTPNQILISNVDSIISSGFAFNDYGTGINDIWSANKIIKEISTGTVNKEKPIGKVDGVNKIFLLSYEPILGSEHIYLNGLLQDSDYDSDYTILGNKITFLDPPMTGSKLKCTYMVKKKTKI
jgi:hypothetical protein